MNTWSCSSTVRLSGGANLTRVHSRKANAAIKVPGPCCFNIHHPVSQILDLGSRIEPHRRDALCNPLGQSTMGKTQHAGQPSHSVIHRVVHSPSQRPVVVSISTWNPRRGSSRGEPSKALLSDRPSRRNDCPRPEGDTLEEVQGQSTVASMVFRGNSAQGNGIQVQQISPGKKERSNSPFCPGAMLTSSPQGMVVNMNVYDS